MKPNQQFINMITKLFQQRKTTLTREDFTMHNSRAVTFYSISQGKFVNNQLFNKTNAFSEQVMIEIERGFSQVIIGTDTSQTVYRRLSSAEFDTYAGRGYIHWQATDSRGTTYLMARIMADDATPQLKIVNTSDGATVVHNICQLPNL